MEWDNHNLLCWSYASWLLYVVQSNSVVTNKLPLATTSQPIRKKKEKNRVAKGLCHNWYTSFCDWSLFLPKFYHLIVTHERASDYDIRVGNGERVHIKFIICPYRWLDGRISYKISNNCCRKSKSEGCAHWYNKICQRVLLSYL
jgi:hypothetical protein